jgi:hypothetical protein
MKDSARKETHTNQVKESIMFGSNIKWFPSTGGGKSY